MIEKDDRRYRIQLYFLACAERYGEISTIGNINHTKHSRSYPRSMQARYKKRYVSSHPGGRGVTNSLHPLLTLNVRHETCV